MAVHVLALVVELHLREPQSLKDKRAVVRPMIEGARRRFAVAASETGFVDLWGRAQLSFVAVSADAGHAMEVIEGVERFVWSFPEVEVVAGDRHWLEVDA